MSVDVVVRVSVFASLDLLAPTVLVKCVRIIAMGAQLIATELVLAQLVKLEVTVHVILALIARGLMWLLVIAMALANVRQGSLALIALVRLAPKLAETGAPVPVMELAHVHLDLRGQLVLVSRAQPWL